MMESKFAPLCKFLSFAFPIVGSILAILLAEDINNWVGVSKGLIFFTTFFVCGFMGLVLYGLGDLLEKTYKIAEKNGLSKKDFEYIPNEQ